MAVVHNAAAFRSESAAHLAPVAQAQQRLRRLQAMHGVCTAAPRWARHTFGVAGERLATAGSVV